jgi:plastin-1
LISEIYRITELNQVSIKNYSGLLNLKKPEEELTDYLKLNSEQLLLRWFNYHLRNATASQAQIQTICNFADDLKDCSKYFLLLNQLSPLCDLSGLRESDLLLRAERMLSNAENIKCRKYISPQEIVNVEASLKLFLTVTRETSRKILCLPPIYSEITI